MKLMGSFLYKNHMMSKLRVHHQYVGWIIIIRKTLTDQNDQAISKKNYLLQAASLLKQPKLYYGVEEEAILLSIISFVQSLPELPSVTALSYDYP
jgi:hypothetical protein